MYLTDTLEKKFRSFVSEKRTRKVFFNIANSFLVKVFSTVITLSLIPVSLQYVDKETYGVWLTLASVITWINLFDLGLSNGLTNKLSEAFARDDLRLAKSLVSTTYSFMIVIVACLCILFFSLWNSLNWNRVFNTALDKTTLMKAIQYTFLSLCVTFLLKPLNDLLKAKQKHFILSIIQVTGNLLALICIVAFGKFFNERFIFLAIALGASYPLTLLIFSIVFYSRAFRNLCPKINLFKFEQLRDIFGISFKFFIINASVIAILTSNNFLISYFVNPESVTYYNISYRLFSIVLIFQYMVVTPLWPAYTDAYVLKDFTWIKATVARINRLNYFLCMSVLLLLLVSPQIFALWIGSSVIIPFQVNALLAIYVIVALFKENYVSFVNGSGNLNLQTLFSIFTLIFQLPFAYFLMKFCNLGLNGILLLNIFWVLLGFILWKCQYVIIIKGLSTKKIWF